MRDVPAHGFVILMRLPCHAVVAACPQAHPLSSIRFAQKVIVNPVDGSLAICALYVGWGSEGATR